MDFDYTEEQRYLQSEARRFLDAACPLSVARAAQDGGAFDPALWNRIAAQGWLGVAIPERCGGLGLSHVELGAILEAIGAALAPMPFGATLAFAEAVMLAGTAAQQAALLPAIASGEAIGCLALWEGAGELDAASIAARVRNGRLTGTKQPVVHGDIADHAIVLAIGDDRPGLYVVALSAAKRTRLESIDTAIGVARLDFSDVPAERLGDGPAPVERLLAHAAALAAFEQIGGADRCLSTTIDYVKERQAFGGSVGRFQAVKHKLADLYVANQIARSHAYHGVWAIGAADGALLVQAAAAARIAACDAYWHASKEAIQLHGAIGFTWEHDAHLFYRRAHHLSLSLGSPGWWKDKLYTRLADRPPIEPGRASDADALVTGVVDPGLTGMRA